LVPWLTATAKPPSGSCSAKSWSILRLYTDRFGVFWSQLRLPPAGTNGGAKFNAGTVLHCFAGLAATPLVDGLSQLSIRLSFPAGIAERPDA